MILAEVAVPGEVPICHIPEWRERYGVVAGITGRREGNGGGFDLGLWGDAPVGETMTRWRRFRRAFPDFPAVVLGNQVHGVEVRRLDAGTGWIQVDGVDGWITSAPGLLLTVTVADCIPVYLLAPGQGVGLLHAGWRGTAGGILERGVAALAAAVGCPPQNLLMHCGVGICGDCYEVGSEVMAGCGVPHEGSGPFRFDLRDALRQRGRALGLEAVTVSPWCSSHDGERFYSHRRSRGCDGRMVAYVGMLGPH